MWGGWVQVTQYADHEIIVTHLTPPRPHLPRPQLTAVLPFPSLSSIHFFYSTHSPSSPTITHPLTRLILLPPYPLLLTHSLTSLPFLPCPILYPNLPITYRQSFSRHLLSLILSPLFPLTLTHPIISLPSSLSPPSHSFSPLHIILSLSSSHSSLSVSLLSSPSPFALSRKVDLIKGKRMLGFGSRLCLGHDLLLFL